MWFRGQPVLRVHIVSIQTVYLVLHLRTWKVTVCLLGPLWWLYGEFSAGKLFKRLSLSASYCAGWMDLAQRACVWPCHFWLFHFIFFRYFTTCKLSVVLWLGLANKKIISIRPNVRWRERASSTQHFFVWRRTYGVAPGEMSSSPCYIRPPRLRMCVTSFGV